MKISLKDLRTIKRMLETTNFAIRRHRDDTLWVSDTYGNLEEFDTVKDRWET